MTTVIAIGWNIFPSTPVSAKIGRYTAVMMPTPNSEGRITSVVASNTTSSRSRSRQRSGCRLVRQAQPAQAVLDDDHRAVDDQAEIERAEAHQIAEMRDCTMPVMVISMESGITAAVISAARMLPSSRNSTTMTSSAPSSRFFCTVAMVLSTSVVRS